MKLNSIAKGAAILSAAGIICRLLGVAFRIPLSNIVGNYGVGLYQLVFPLYSLLLIISSAGMPIAISKIISRKPQQKKQILFNSIIVLGVTGLIISILLVIFAKQIAIFQNKQGAYLLYFAIAPSVFLVCLISAFRGYFQGQKNMLPTAVSQIVEQIVKVALGLSLALLLLKNGVLWAIFGSIIAVSASEFIACIVLLVWSKKTKKTEKKTPDRAKIDFKLIKEIFKEALPITLMSAVFPLCLMFDSFFVPQNLPINLYGISSGAVHTLVNLPTVVSLGVATALLPHLTSQKQKSKTNVRNPIVLVGIFAVVCGAIMFIFAPLILNLLYHGAFKNKPDEFTLAVKLLHIESFLIILICLQQVITSILQAKDRSKWPLIALLLGGTAKVIFELTLINKIGIQAVSYANLICFTVALSVNILALICCKKQTKSVT
ncbi:MAG: polysaccharide biosynthesis protein [Christensenellaceae bacterium]|jgi:stage V sporulation protein B|nr:polysaccharide biosynthesis protein [Christensenellaceae bacterium]